MMAKTKLETKVKRKDSAAGLRCQIRPHRPQGVLLQPGHLRLGDADHLRDLHLCFTLEKAQGDNLMLPGI